MLGRRCLEESPGTLLGNPELFEIIYDNSSTRGEEGRPRKRFTLFSRICAREHHESLIANGRP